MRHFHPRSRLGFVVGVMLLAGAGGPTLSANGPTDLDVPPAALSAPTIDIQAREAPSPRTTQREREPSGNPLWAIPLSSLSATRERPIFRLSRRPPTPAVAARAPDPVAQAAAPPAEPEPPKLALVGAIVGETEAIAVFLDQENSNAVVRLRLGQDHAGWVLNSVKGREAILQRDGESAVFALPAPDSINAPLVPGLQRNVIIPLANPGANPSAAVPTGPLVMPSRSGDFAPFVPRSTPKNGEPDGL